jgi:membrane protease YdiL (CAAX protease family)
MNESKADLPQNHKSLRERIGNALRTNKFAIFGAILIILFISQILKFTLPDYSFWGIPLALLAIWVISWLEGEGWSYVGLSRPESWANTIKMALYAMLIVQVIGILQGTLQHFLGTATPDLSSYEERMTPLWLLRWILISWTTAGVGEEIIYRGFYMKQVARLFGEQKRSSWMIGLVISSIVFGLVHFHQGIGGMLGVGITGLVFGYFYLRSERNLWVPIIAHGLTGTIRFIMLYLSQL